MPANAIYITDAPYSCDPTGIADCTSAINAALATGAPVIIPGIPGAIWRIEGWLNFASGNTLDTEGGHRASINRGSPVNQSYLFSLWGSEIQINGKYKVDATQTGEGLASGLVMINTSVSREYIHLGDIISYGATAGITNTPATPGIINHFYSEQLCMRAHRGRGAYLNKFFAHNNFHRLSVDYVSNLGATVDVPAVTVFNAEGLRFWEFNVQGQAPQPGRTGGNWQRGLYAENCGSVKIVGAITESLLSHGMHFVNCYYTDLVSVESSNNRADGFIFENCVYTETSNCSAFSNSNRGLTASGGSLNWKGGVLAGNTVQQYNINATTHRLDAMLTSGAVVNIAGASAG